MSATEADGCVDTGAAPEAAVVEATLPAMTLDGLADCRFDREESAFDDGEDKADDLVGDGLPNRLAALL